MMLLANSGNMHWICIEFLWEVRRQFSFKQTLFGSSISSAHKGMKPNKNSKWKLLTPGKIEKHLIPYNFNSKGDNLRQVEFLIEFEAVCWEFLIK